MREGETINVISMKVWKHHTSNDSVFSVFLWPLALCRHIKCWSSLKTHSCSSFQLDFDSCPTIDNLIISRFLYPHLICPNSYSKFILELRKLRSQRHLALNTSKWNSVIWCPKITWPLDSQFPFQCRHPI